MKIVNAPSNILGQKIAKVTKFDAKLKTIVNQMITTLESQTDPEGVGLSANQVGLNLAVFIIKPERDSIPQVFVNAEIISKTNNQKTKSTAQDTNKEKSSYIETSNKKQDPTSQKPKKPKRQKTKLEGCLSIPRIWGRVDRFDRVKIRYQDLDGNKHIQWFSGFRAIIIQHEIDHLDGILFTQKALAQNQKLYKEEHGELHEVSI